MNKVLVTLLVASGSPWVASARQLRDLLLTRQATEAK